MNTEDQTLKTPEAWAKEQGITILDPDGWRGEWNKDFDEPISQEEFHRRMQISTCMVKIRNEKGLI